MFGEQKFDRAKARLKLVHRASTGRGMDRSFMVSSPAEIQCSTQSSMSVEDERVDVQTNEIESKTQNMY